MWRGRIAERFASVDSLILAGCIRCHGALHEFENVDHEVRGEIAAPEERLPQSIEVRPADAASYDLGKSVATRTAFGSALKRLAGKFPQIVSLDGEVSNSTMAEIFEEKVPERFFEMFIAEQLEDIAMFRTIQSSVVLHPCDALSTAKLVEVAAAHVGIVYLRTLRQSTPVIYGQEVRFEIGGSKVLRQRADDSVTIVAAGSTVHEALKAHDQLQRKGISTRIIDAYSIKPLDVATLREAADATAMRAMSEIAPLTARGKRRT